MPYTIITQPNCPACQNAKKELTLSAKTYLEVDITRYENQYIKNLMKWAGLDTVPQIWNHEGDFIGGYKELQEYDKELR
jgi:glutaredoxin